MKSKLQRIISHPFALVGFLYLFINSFRFMIVADSEWEDVFVLAANRLVHGLDIYQLVPESHDHAYSYPPLQALLAIPFILFTKTISRFLWLAVNWIAVALLWRFSWKASGGKKMDGQPQPLWPEITICIIGLATSMRFVQDNLEHQQTDAVIGVLLIGGLLLWQNARSFLAATLWAIAAAMKGPPLLLAPYLAWRGKYLAALWMVLLAIAVNLLPDLVHRAPQGIWLTHWYDQMIRPVAQIGQWHSAPENNQSLAGAAHEIFSQSIPNSQLKLAVYAVEALLVALSALSMARPFKPPTDKSQAALEVSIVMVLMLMLSPMSSKPHFCILLLPGFCLAREAILNKSKSAIICLAICILLADVLDRNISGKSIGLFAMQHASVMWTAAALGLGCVIAHRRQQPEI